MGSFSVWEGDVAGVSIIPGHQIFGFRPHCFDDGFFEMVLGRWCQQNAFGPQHALHLQPASMMQQEPPDYTHFKPPPFRKKPYSARNGRDEICPGKLCKTMGPDVGICEDWLGEEKKRKGANICIYTFEFILLCVYIDYTPYIKSIRPSFVKTRETIAKNCVIQSAK